MTDWRALCAELLDAEQDQTVANDGSSDRFDTVAARARAALVQPAPPAEGEVVSETRYLIKELRDQADDLSPSLELFGLMHRAADLLERQQQLADLAADAVSALRYIEQQQGRLYGVGWDRVYEKADRLQPAHVLPIPRSENVLGTDTGWSNFDE